MRPEIKRLQLLGPLPSEDDATVDHLKLIEPLFKAISKPVSDDEARALVSLLGPDDCFGVAWSFVHLIETAPNWPLRDCLDDMGNGWVAILRERVMCSGVLL
jgi:hypothetical protein